MLALKAVGSIITLACSALSITACHSGTDNKTSAQSVVSGASSVTNGQYGFVQYPNSAGMSQYYSLINSAKKSVSIEIYSLNDKTLETALINAAKRGVTVHVMLDSAFGGNKFNSHAYANLKSNGVSVEWAPSGYIFHIKTTVIDGKTAVVSTSNLNTGYTTAQESSRSATDNNASAPNYDNTRDASIITTNSAQVSAIAQTFANDWTLKGKPNEHTVNAPGLLWSPGAESGMVSAIKAAKSSVDFSSEELAYAPVVEALASDAKRGVSCNVLMTYEAKYSDNYSKLRSAGCHLHLIKESSKNIYIHEKIVLTDGSNLLMGSQNASSYSLNRNRELSIALTKANAGNIINSVASTFDKDSASATMS